MNFNKHLELEGQHAFLSASKHSWINYDDDRLLEAYAKSQAAQRGTDLHDLAEKCIRLGVMLPKTKMTLNQYVNDAIGYRMTPEQPLYYSRNCFGTTDAISFRNGKLRIHDLKTGIGPTSMDQLKIYAALFCLEYGMKPDQFKTELRIYQSNEVESCVPEPSDIYEIMKKIVKFDKLIEKTKLEGGA